MYARNQRYREIASAAGLIVAGAGLIAGLDRVTGSHVSLASIYVTLAVYGGWRWGRTGAVLASFASVVAAIASELAPSDLGSPSAHTGLAELSLWTVGLRFLVYLLVSMTIASLRATVQERDRALAELRLAITEVETLRGLLPICAWCKQIRDDEHEGEWVSVERYIAQRTPAKFTHGICPACAEKLASSAAST